MQSDEALPASRFENHQLLPYSEIIVARLPEALAEAVRNAMPVPDDWEPQNEWIQALKAKGRREGEAQGQANAILGFLRNRRIALSAEERATILACTDPATLERWISRAVTARTAAELFADD